MAIMECLFQSRTLCFKVFFPINKEENELYFIKRNESSEATKRIDEKNSSKFYRQTMTYSGVNITMINYYFP